MFKVSTNIGHHVRQPIGHQLLLPENHCQYLYININKIKRHSQFKSPWHHEDEHLGVFWQGAIWTLGVMVCPWHGEEGLQPQLGVIARGACHTGQSLLQQLIH